MDDLFFSATTPTLETGINWNNCLISFQMTTIFDLSNALMTPLLLPLFFDSSTSILCRSSSPGLSSQPWIPGESLNHCASIFKLPPPSPTLPCYTHAAKHGTGLVLQLLSAGCWWKTSNNHTDSCNNRLVASTLSQVLSVDSYFMYLTFISSFLHFPLRLSNFLHFL